MVELKILEYPCHPKTISRTRYRKKLLAFMHSGFQVNSEQSSPTCTTIVNYTCPVEVASTSPSLPPPVYKYNKPYLKMHC